MAAFGVQLLKRGLALCGENFAGFVEAWNHVVRRSANVCGDGDANPSEGLITVDNTDVDHPVIRLDTSRLPSGSGSGCECKATPEPFLTRASVSNGTLTVEMYSVASEPMVKVNATSIVTWENSFGSKDGWQTVYSGSATELTLYAKFEMISAIETSGVVNAGGDVRADIFTADGADPWDTDVGETEAIQMIVVPIARVSAAGAVEEQYHTGVLRFYVPVPKVKGGSDSNIAFTFDTNKRLNIDVYYV